MDIVLHASYGHLPLKTDVYSPLGQRVHVFDPVGENDPAGQSVVVDASSAVSLTEK